MKFLLGLAVGAVGMWAYSTGKLQGVMGQAPEPMQDAFNRASQQVSQVADSEQVRGFVSKAQDKAQEIATPTASEVSGRPSSPLPTSEP
ncbi:MAG TPA: hypothetical protein VGJ60_08350 [Chloroflexota bacterium]|jgi:hypothetical protein